ncbi:hypothetical protein ASPZODRAFT_15705 [Penicilliopsis zonata CBS 506.65]|uniref:Integral membrane protein n=1 Tax=Penicilliopsis zonata CBS 506.65 TaxID=1073090 RepID=A0A1L9SIH9_9EURO|nr:hypothetical protein ASPZODRAFT_15705 [Penicilliopsis zonata CBS 506.65]OJJ47019.1 hypothetical protein ASPZODRAFT_15705 [Penicilliopsis zonata CBS 506.65]
MNMQYPTNMIRRRALYDFHDTGSPWNEDTTLSLPAEDHIRAYYIASVALNILTLLALLGFLVWGCLIRQVRRGSVSLPLMALQFSIGSFIIYEFLTALFLLFTIIGVTVKQSFVIMFMIGHVFYATGLVLLFYIFYELIQRYLERIAAGGKTFVPVAIVHWTIVSLLGILSVVECVAYIVRLVESIDSKSYSLLARNWTKLYGTQNVICWLMALEILIWVCFVTAKSGAHRFSARTGAIFLTAGAIFFFILNFSSAVVAIRYYLEEKYVAPIYMNVVNSTIAFVSVVCAYTGILSCCTQCQKIGAEYLSSSQQYARPLVPYHLQQYDDRDDSADD